MTNLTIYAFPDAPGRQFFDAEEVTSRLPKLQVHVLSRAVHEQIRKAFPAIAVTNETSPMQAGYQLGVAKVLDVLLKEGFLQDYP